MKDSSKIRGVIFDFDGVILDSMDVKSQAFVKLFSDYPRWAIESIVGYHAENGGMSRRKKIEYFYANIMNQKAPCELDALEEKFGHHVLEILQDSKFVIKDCVDFIKKIHSDLPLFVASAAPENEVIELLKFHDLFHYFRAVGGSPRRKSEIISTFLDRFKLNAQDCVLIGDSMNDLKAAEDTGTQFWGYNNLKLKERCLYVNSLMSVDCNGSI